MRHRLQSAREEHARSQLSRRRRAARRRRQHALRGLEDRAVAGRLCDHRAGPRARWRQLPRRGTAGLPLRGRGELDGAPPALPRRVPHVTRPPALGRGYSRNGDFLAFAFGTKDEMRASEGPTITTGIVYDRPDAGNRSWFIFEEGGYPREIARLLQLLDPGRSWLADAGH